MAVKSLMFQYVNRYEYFKPEHIERELYKELVNHYYRGLCVRTTNRNHFCNEPAMLSFNLATFTAPILFISLLYLPSFFYVLRISFKLFGFQNWMNKFFENPVLFILPLFTSFSFFQILEVEEVTYQTKNLESRRKRRTLSAPTDIITKSEDAVEEDSNITPNENETNELENQTVGQNLSLPH